MRGGGAQIHDKGLIKEKLTRLAGGARPRVLDLFSGCGGISLGFERAGFEIAAAIELDAHAAATHAANFFKTCAPETTAHHAKPRNILEVEPDELAHELGLGPIKKAFDVVVGGPPCQAYTRIGRAKLREIAAHPAAYKIDPRANLYLRYLHYVKATTPLALLIENVPDALNFGGHNVMAEIADALAELGYEARYTLLNAAFYGIPQMRERAFLLAYHRSIEATIRFPKPIRHMSLPRGYNGVRSVALKHIDLFDGGNFVESDRGSARLRFPVTCKEALGDLPPITLHMEGKLRRGARRFDQCIPYASNGREVRGYARLMRRWPGFEAELGVWDHVIRYLPRDIQTFSEMPNGAEYPAAHATAVSIWERRVTSEEKRAGRKLSKTEREKLRDLIVPPYPLGSFPNRWWKLLPNFPSRTLMAHLGKDTYSHIHYDSKQARVISVREAARLQSFPDGFRFCGTMNPAYRQIGNAVPPLLAWAIAREMAKSLQAAVRFDNKFTAGLVAEAAE